jgi:hypothetical protein
MTSPSPTAEHMVEVVLALAAIAVTAAIVIGDARPARREEPLPPEQPAFEDPHPIPLPLAIETIDSPTEAFDASALAAEPSLTRTTFSLPLPSAQVLPSDTPAALGRPHPRPDPDRLIQTEVFVPQGSGEQARAVTRLVIGISAAGLALGLAIMGLGRAIGLFIHAL